jgi:hypothetical protein
MPGHEALAVWFAMEPAGTENIDAWYARDHLPDWPAVPRIMQARSYEVVGAGPPYFALYETTAARPPFTADRERPVAVRAPWTIKQAVCRRYRELSAAGDRRPRDHILTVRLTSPRRPGAARAWLTDELAGALRALRGTAGAAAFEADAAASVIGRDEGLLAGTILDGPRFLVICEVTDAAVEMSLARFWTDRALDIGAEVAIDLYRLLDASARQPDAA